MSDETQRLLSPSEVAEYCGLNYRTVLRAIEAGELPASRLCSRLRVSRYDMLAWIHAGEVRPRPHDRHRTRGLARRKKFAVGSLKKLNEEHV